MEIWEKVRRFLLFWLAVLLVLVIASLAVHGPALAGAIASNIRSGLTTLIIAGIIIAALVWLIRGIF